MSIIPRSFIRCKAVHHSNSYMGTELGTVHKHTDGLGTQMSNLSYNIIDFTRVIISNSLNLHSIPPPTLKKKKDFKAKVFLL